MGLAPASKLESSGASTVSRTPNNTNGRLPRVTSCCIFKTNARILFAAINIEEIGYFLRDNRSRRRSESISNSLIPGMRVAGFAGFSRVKGIVFGYWKWAKLDI